MQVVFFSCEVAVGEMNNVERPHWVQTSKKFWPVVLGIIGAIGSILCFVLIAHRDLIAIYAAIVRLFQH